jgi:hypothetical protein
MSACRLSRAAAPSARPRRCVDSSTQEGRVAGRDAHLGSVAAHTMTNYTSCLEWNNGGCQCVAASRRKAFAACSAHALRVRHERHTARLGHLRRHGRRVCQAAGERSQNAADSEPRAKGKGRVAHRAARHRSHTAAAARPHAQIVGHMQRHEAAVRELVLGCQAGAREGGRIEEVLAHAVHPATARREQAGRIALEAAVLDALVAPAARGAVPDAGMAAAGELGDVCPSARSGGHSRGLVGAYAHLMSRVASVLLTALPHAASGAL